MIPTETGRTWDEAASPAAVDLARRFELAWHAAPAGRRPEPAEYLPENPGLRPPVLLALLRTELALRFESGESPRIERYVEKFSDLDDDALVALVYEEFCLREEQGELPGIDEYARRFPDLIEPLRRVLDIHSLVGPCPSTATHQPTGACDDAPPFPEAGQTIGGFHLVAEIGRGSFARVFRAEERQLADRPVALKVSRTASREPQALARLQHTHIVPVYSYRTDPVTGLHLLCMPLLGKLTLANVLADGATKTAKDGSSLVAILERLQPHDGRHGRPAGRLALARRGFTEAIAWWGARMAEALQHAHDRGVLHRDVKPSNVLITADGLPMLLDFNLAQQPLDDDDEPEALGGTLAYMAPEHLQALADGRVDGIDGRADVYALGVMLYESVAGKRPFANPRQALNVREALRQAIAERQAGPPPLRHDFPEIPAAFEAVIDRCLAPNPADRYEHAADLAADLQAVADDAPLRFAREPITSRVVRGMKRHRLALAVAAPIAVALGLLAWIGYDSIEKRRQLREQYHEDAIALMRLADESDTDGSLDLANLQYDQARQVARRAIDAGITPRDFARIEALARGQQIAVADRRRFQERTDAIGRDIEPLYAELLDPASDAATVGAEIRQALAPFFVFANPRWSDQVTLEAPQCDDPRVDRLIAEIDDLLFLYAVELDRDGHHRPETAPLVRDLCDRAADTGPWRSLRSRWSDSTDLGSAPASPEDTTSPRTCVQWALWRDLDGDPADGLHWLNRAVELDPADFMARYLLALWLDRDGRPDQARVHAEAALAVRPASPQARRLRDRLRAAEGNPTVAR